MTERVKVDAFLATWPYAGFIGMAARVELGDNCDVIQILG